MQLFESKTDIVRSLLWFVIGLVGAASVFAAYGVESLRTIVAQQVAEENFAFRREFERTAIELVARSESVAQGISEEAVPRGALLAFGGTQGCPLGWERYEAVEGRFLLGAGEEFKIGSGGGAAQTTLVVENLPSQIMVDLEVFQFSQPNSIGLSSNQSRVVGDIDPIRVQGSRPINNMPPFVAVLYCIKI